MKSVLTFGGCSICEGEKYKDIAERLFISERTVTTHVQNIFKKTKVTSKIELLNKLGEKAKIKDNDNQLSI